MLIKLKNAFKFAVINFGILIGCLAMAIIVIFAESLTIKNPFAFIIVSLLSLIFFILMCVGFVNEKTK